MKNTHLSSFISFIKPPDFSGFSRDDYLLFKFDTNNLRMIILASILIVEQFLLGIIVAETGSLMRAVYFFTAGVLLVYAAAGFSLYIKKPRKINPFHNIFEISYLLFIMAVAISRFMVFENDLSRVPTIYIAVLYGAAVIFEYDLLQGIFVYTACTLITLILLPVFNPGTGDSRFAADVISNGIIAWAVVFINYRRFQHAYADKKHIELMNSELREQSIRDALTGLYNRRKLDEVFGEVCLKAERYKNDFSIIIMDIDHFKNVNDVHGHHTGDAVLIEIARVIENNIREVDVCGRWGGEEFLIICQQTELGAAFLLADRLRGAIEQHAFSSGPGLTASFGVASWAELRDPQLLIQSADLRLYQTKKAGRNSVTAGSSQEFGGRADVRSDPVSG